MPRSLSLALVLTAIAPGCVYDFDRLAPTSSPDGGGTPDTRPADALVTPDASAPDAPAPTGCTEPLALAALGRCYFPASRALGWTEAQAACKSAGGHLVTITTADEGIALQTFGGGERWMGYARAEGSANEPSAFTWVTGEATGFTRWGSGSPSGTGLCAYMDPGGVWRDRACTDALVGICERP